MQAAIATMQANPLMNQACPSIRRRSYHRAKPRRPMLSAGSMQHDRERRAKKKTPGSFRAPGGEPSRKMLRDGGGFVPEQKLPAGALSGRASGLSSAAGGYGLCAV